MSDFSDLIPANLKPSVSDGVNLKPSITTSNYTGGTPTAANQVKPSIMYSDGRLKESVANELGIKPSLLLGNVPVLNEVVDFSNTSIDFSSESYDWSFV